MKFAIHITTIEHKVIEAATLEEAGRQAAELKNAAEKFRGQLGLELIRRGAAIAAPEGHE